MKKICLLLLVLSLFFNLSCSKKKEVPVQSLFNFKELTVLDKNTPINSELKPPLSKEWDKKIFDSKLIKKYARFYRNFFIRYNPEEFSTPEVHGGRIYAGGSDGNFYCLSITDGKLIWKLTGTSAIFGTPFIYENDVIISSNGFLWRLNSENGKVVWKFPVETDVISKPATYKNKMFFLQTNNKLYAVDINSTEKIWSYAEEMPEKITILGASSPILFDSLIYAGFSNGAFAALNPNDGTEVWKKNFKGSGQFNDIDSTALIFNDRIYLTAFDDHFYCLNIKDGSLIWKNNIGGIAKAEVYKDTLIYAASMGGVVSLSIKDGTFKWGVYVKDKFLSPPAIIGNIAYFSDNDNFLYALNLDSAKLVWKYSIKGGSYTKPVYDAKNKRLVVHSNDGYIYTFSAR